MKRILVLMIMALAACKLEKPAKPAANTPAKPGAKGAQTATQAEVPAASTNVGDAMPSYSAKRLDGSPFDLASEKGNVVLVNVWATWCGPCRFEIPELQKMHDQYAN